MYGYLTGNVEYWNHTSPCWSCGNYTALDLGMGAPGAAWTPDHSQRGRYSTNVFGARAVDIIAAHDPAERLFLYLPFEAVHGAANCDVPGAPPDCKRPAGDLLQAPPEYVARVPPSVTNANRRTFGGMIAALDEAVGNVTDALRRAGLWDDTLLIWTTGALRARSRLPTR